MWSTTTGKIKKAILETKFNNEAIMQIVIL